MVLKKRLTGIFAILLGAFVVIGLRTIFPVCQVTEEMVMKCHWTDRISSFAGVGVIVVGILHLILKNEDTKAGLDIALLAQGLLLILTPTVLIGTCATHMNCHDLTRPILVIVGGILIVLALVDFIRNRLDSKA